MAVLNVPAFAVILLVSFCFLSANLAAEETQRSRTRVESATKGVGWFSGKDSPDDIPDWLAVRSVVSNAQRLERHDPGKGYKFLLSIGISAEGAGALLNHPIGTADADSSGIPDLKSDLCARRDSIVTSDDLAAAIQRRGEEGSRKQEELISTLYAMLKAEDAAKLRGHAVESKPQMAVLGVSDFKMVFKDTDPQLYLSKLCKGVA